jgi:3-deoxy-D-manno-octulosonic-acid transferase
VERLARMVHVLGQTAYGVGGAAISRLVALAARWHGQPADALDVDGWLRGRVAVPRSERPRIWLHGGSIGELRLLRPLVDELRRAMPSLEFVFSAGTHSGMRAAGEEFPSSHVFRCPLDLPWAAGEAVRRVRPRLLVFSEFPSGPLLVRAACDSGVPVAVVNGRLTDRDVARLGPVRSCLWRSLEDVRWIGAQTELFARRFAALGARREAIHVTGGMKFDSACAQRDNPATRRLVKLAGIGEEDVVFLAGSTHDPEERLAIAAFRELADEFPRLKFVLVPRNTRRFARVGRMLNATRVRWQRRSRLAADGADPQARILLVDTIGELGAWWGRADIAFVGGSLSRRGGHNMIEPAAYGAAVCFGPHALDFREVVDTLVENRSAAIVGDGVELTAFVRRCLAEPEFARTLGRQARLVVAGQRGAARRTFEALAPLLGIETNLPAIAGTRGDSLPSAPVRSVA